MATHVRADPDVEFGRRRQPEMGIEADDGVDLAYRYLQTLRHAVQLLDREITKLVLDGP